MCRNVASNNFVNKRKLCTSKAKCILRCLIGPVSSACGPESVSQARPGCFPPHVQHFLVSYFLPSSLSETLLAEKVRDAEEPL